MNAIRPARPLEPDSHREQGTTRTWTSRVRSWSPAVIGAVVAVIASTWFPHHRLLATGVVTLALVAAAWATRAVIRRRRKPVALDTHGRP